MTERKLDTTGFCREALAVAFDGCDLDGGSIQDMAEKYGLVEEVKMTERCGESCICAEMDDFPLTCYRYTEAFKALLPRSDLLTKDKE